MRGAVQTVSESFCVMMMMCAIFVSEIGCIAPGQTSSESASTSASSSEKASEGGRRQTGRRLMSAPTVTDLFPPVWEAILQAGRIVPRPAATQRRYEYNVSAQCSESLRDYLQGYSRREAWAVRMYDSSGKPSPGMMVGGLLQDGNYDECLNIHGYPEFQSNNTSALRRTHYCSVFFAIPVWMSKFFQSLEVPYPVKLSRVTVDLCVPRTCTPNDLYTIVSQYVSSGSHNVTVEEEVLCFKHQELSEDAAAVTMVVVLGLILALVILGTCLDLVEQLGQYEATSGKVVQVGFRRRMTRRLSRVGSSVYRRWKRIGGGGEGQEDFSTMRRNTIGHKPSLLRRISNTFVGKYDSPRPTPKCSIVDLPGADVFAANVEPRRAKSWVGAGGQRPNVGSRGQQKRARSFSTRGSAQSQSGPGLHLGATSGGQLGMLGLAKLTALSSGSDEGAEEENVTKVGNAEDGSHHQQATKTTRSAPSESKKTSIHTAPEPSDNAELRVHFSTTVQCAVVRSDEEEDEEEEEEEKVRIQANTNNNMPNKVVPLLEKTNVACKLDDLRDEGGKADDAAAAVPDGGDLSRSSYSKSGDVSGDSKHPETALDDSRSSSRSSSRKSTPETSIRASITKGRETSGGQESGEGYVSGKLAGDISANSVAETNGAPRAELAGTHEAAEDPPPPPPSSSSPPQQLPSQQEPDMAEQPQKLVACKDAVETPGGDGPEETGRPDPTLEGKDPHEVQESERDPEISTAQGQLESSSQQGRLETRNQGQLETRNQGQLETRNQGQLETRNQGQLETSNQTQLKTTTTTTTTPTTTTTQEQLQTSNEADQAHTHTALLGAKTAEESPNGSPVHTETDSPNLSPSAELLTRRRKSSTNSNAKTPDKPLSAQSPRRVSSRGPGEVLQRPSRVSGLLSIPEEGSAPQAKPHPVNNNHVAYRGGGGGAEQDWCPSGQWSTSPRHSSTSEWEMYISDLEGGLLKRPGEDEDEEDGNHEEGEEEEEEGKKAKKEKRGLVAEVLITFSFMKSVRRVIGEGCTDHLFSLNGVRVLSICWIVLGNTMGLMNKSFQLVNKVDIAKRGQTPWFQAVMNGTFPADTFFILSGCLLCYHFLRAKSKQLQEKPDAPVFTVKSVLLFYLHRFMRIAPCFYVVLLLYTTLLPYFGRGPHWESTDHVLRPCREHWWANALFFSNFYQAQDMCMAWSYYLVNDLQMYLLSPLVLYPLLFFPSIGLLLLVSLVILQIVSTLVLTEDCSGNLLSMSPDFFATVYAKPYCRVGGFAIGMGLGYFLHCTRRQIFFRKIPLILGWLTSLAVVGTVIYVTYDGTKEGGEGWTGRQCAVYQAFSRPLWCLAVAFIIFVCCIGQGGFVYRILSCNIFVPLCRTTYGVYLLHPVLIDVVQSGSRYPLYFTFSTLVYQFVSNVVCSYGLAFFLITMVESPFTTLEAVLRNRL